MKKAENLLKFLKVLVNIWWFEKKVLLLHAKSNNIHKSITKRAKMKTDIEISREARLRPIGDVARGLGIAEDAVELYGKWMCKVDNACEPTNSNANTNDEADGNANNKLILVTAVSPTKSGIGKTTVSIGLALGLNKIGKRGVLALREPSLGPCFGMKGGAAGGGYAQVLPMDKINLHFTGDFHAVTSANNLIAAALDNKIFRGLELRERLWRRVMDMNDRALRGEFDITPASEIMAILCLATDENDLRRRVDNILLGTLTDGRPYKVKDLGITGSVMVLLQDAMKPNLVQTTERTPAFIHGGPFANIAHGCNSIMATRMALRYGEYCVTEAGFGADLGAEKFFDIKCRVAGLCPALTVLVATTKGIEEQGGYENLDKHVRNLQGFGQTVLVCFNRFGFDTDEDMQRIADHCAELGVEFAECSTYAHGGAGAIDFAHKVVELIDRNPSGELKYLYELSEGIRAKIEKVAKNYYGAGSVEFSAEAEAKIARAEELGCGSYAVCIAKTQYSLSDDPKLGGAPQGFNFRVRDIVINGGSEMIVAIAGEIMRMPGLPSVPMAEKINLINGEIVGLS